MKLSLAQLAIAVNAPWQGIDVVISHIGIDSRAVEPNSLFVAIRGQQFDGHDFIEAAVNAGASAVVVDHPVNTPVPQLVVADTRIALGQLAAFYRQAFDIPVIGVTGSCGKTTTKTLLASILSQAGKVLATQGTLNNDLGVPLTLFGLNSKHDYAVIEMGANHPGEIAYLTQIAQPSVGLITNAAGVHLEGFGSLDGVAQAKGELYQHLPVDGIAILNRDDAKQGYWRTVIGARAYLTYGLTSSADTYATEIELNEQGQPQFLLHHGGEQTLIHLPLLGVHNVVNALAAAAVGFSLGLSLRTIRKGLHKVEGVARRTDRRVGYQGATVIDDSYNANPTAFKAAIDLLCHLPNFHQRWLIMGDMGELGEEAVNGHQQVGAYAKQAKVDRLFTVGPLSRYATDAFGEGASHFADQASLIDTLKPLMTAATLVLIKGSKSSHMEHIVHALSEPLC